MGKPVHIRCLFRRIGAGEIGLEDAPRPCPQRRGVCGNRYPAVHRLVTRIGVSRTVRKAPSRSLWKKHGLD